MLDIYQAAQQRDIDERETLKNARALLKSLRKKKAEVETIGESRHSPRINPFSEHHQKVPRVMKALRSGEISYPEAEGQIDEISSAYGREQREMMTIPVDPKSKVADPDLWLRRMRKKKRMLDHIPVIMENK